MYWRPDPIGPGGSAGGPGESSRARAVADLLSIPIVRTEVDSTAMLDVTVILGRDWSAARVLVVGTGRYASRTVEAVRARGAADIEVFSPSGRAAA